MGTLVDRYDEHDGEPFVALIYAQKLISRTGSRNLFPPHATYLLFWWRRLQDQSMELQAEEMSIHLDWSSVSSQAG
jgi:hypothetical protein